MQRTGKDDTLKSPCHLFHDLKLGLLQSSDVGKCWPFHSSQNLGIYFKTGFHASSEWECLHHDPVAVLSLMRLCLLTIMSFKSFKSCQLLQRSWWESHMASWARFIAKNLKDHSSDVAVGCAWCHCYWWRLMCHVWTQWWSMHKNHSSTTRHILMYISRQPSTV